MDGSEETLRQMSVADFVRRFKREIQECEDSKFVFLWRFKREIQECEDSKFVFFIGAGCSISSDIPGATDLVKMWLRSLRKLRIGDENDYERWAKKEFVDYDEKCAAKHYGKVIEELFLIRRPGRGRLSG